MARTINTSVFLIHSIGYHAVPSMQRLHLHVLSTDFNSPCLKNKYHWNSFTTPFFLPSSGRCIFKVIWDNQHKYSWDKVSLDVLCFTDICKQLQERGELKKLKSEESAEYLNTPLKCHKCSVTPKNMPDLKRHLLTHLSDRKSTNTTD